MTAETELPILDAEVVAVETHDLDALLERPLQYPPAMRVQVSCRCGKRDYAAHGGFSCDEVLAIAARVQAGAAEPAWRQYVIPVAGGLAALAAGGLLVWVVVLGVTALVETVTAAAAWLSANWLGIAGVVLLLALLFAGGAKCAGLHCGGCRG